MSTTQDIIRQLRAAGMSQSEIARRVRMPQPRVSRWEAGDVPTGADDALKLAELLREVEAQQNGASAPQDAGTSAATKLLAERGRCGHQPQAVEGTLCLSTALPMATQPDGSLRCAMCVESGARAQESAPQPEAKAA